jgi:hypothetical protein
MTRIKIIAATAALATVSLASPSSFADDSHLQRAWMVGLNLGELPWGGSFKPGLSVGYHYNELLYIGGFYQIGDSIRRDGSSFNVENTRLDGIVASSEDVASRAYLGVRLRPHRYSPFATLGFVYNGADTETMEFDARERHIGQGTYDGAITILSERPAALRPAIGLGYSYTFDWGLNLSTAWAGWIFEKPTTNLSIDAQTPLTDDDERVLRRHIQDGFGSTLTNKYHVFHLGAGYTFGAE